MSRAEEIAKRRARAVEEGLSAELSSGEPWLGRYRVRGASGRVHEVRFRWARGAAHRCDCQDYQSKGLGTCKHIEAVRLHLERALSYEERASCESRAARPGWLGRLDAPDVLFFDVETKRLFQEVGGRQHVDRLGLAAAVTYSEADGGFQTYLEEGAEALVTRLLGAGLVVGFNTLQFDYEVLTGYTAEADRLWATPSLDLCFELEQKLAWRPSLESLAQGTLGETKTGSGLEAVAWYREGRIDDVVRYCRHDVELTRALFRAGLAHGYLDLVNRQGERVRVEVPWGVGAAA